MHPVPCMAAPCTPTWLYPEPCTPTCCLACPQNRSEAYLNSPVETLVAEEVSATTEENFKNVYKMCKMWRDDLVVVKVGMCVCGGGGGRGG